VIASTVLIVLLMMGAESTRNMWSNLEEKNKYDFLKLHHIGYLIKQVLKNFFLEHPQTPQERKNVQCVLFL
jgi:hypothetical protein